MIKVSSNQNGHITTEVWINPAAIESITRTITKHPEKIWTGDKWDFNDNSTETSVVRMIGGSTHSFNEDKTIELHRAVDFP